MRDLIFAHAKVAEDAKVGKGERRFLICNFGLEEGFTLRRFKWTRLWPRPGRGRYGAGGWFWGVRGEGRAILDVLFVPAVAGRADARILDCWKLGEIVTKRRHCA